MFKTPPANPSRTNPRDAASSSGRPACIVKEKPLRHFVARHLGGQEGGEFKFAHNSRALARHADGNADLAPERVGHADDRDLADAGMGEDLLLDFARIDIGSTGYV